MLHTWKYIMLYVGYSSIKNLFLNIIYSPEHIWNAPLYPKNAFLAGYLFESGSKHKYHRLQSVAMSLKYPFFSNSPFSTCYRMEKKMRPLCVDSPYCWLCPCGNYSPYSANACLSCNLIVRPRDLNDKLRFNVKVKNLSHEGLCTSFGITLCDT